MHLLDVQSGTDRYSASPLTDPHQNWLEHAKETMLGLGPRDDKGPAPVTFLLGAGTSVSSRCPTTDQILDECRHRRPTLFPDDQAVYDKFSTFAAADERDELIRPLFEKVEPYVGYHCLAAMARDRLVFVANLNWDPCLKLAAERLDVPCERFDLRELERGRRLIDAAKAREHGIVCAHIHGYFHTDEEEEQKREEDELIPGRIRFAHPETVSFSEKELRLLREVLSPATIVVGTSLAGTPDADAMVQALIPEDDEAAKLWVFERGTPARVPGFSTRISIGLSQALLARHSMENYVKNTDVDFDLLMTTMRAEDVGLPWESIHTPRTPLPRLDKLVPPDPDAVRGLLHRDRSLIVGAPYVGSSTLAYLIAWWRCLIEARDRGRPPVVKGFKGLDQANACTRAKGLAAEVGAVVVDDLFGDGADPPEVIQRRLAQLFAQVGDRPLITTSTPALASARACAETGLLGAELEMTVVWARSLWKPENLRAWARAAGGDKAELVCRLVRMGVISTPSQAARVLGGFQPHEAEKEWRQRLADHLQLVYRFGNRNALALILLRLQDFSVPRAAKELIRGAGAGATEELLGDPWGICAEMHVDAERYLRLANPGVVSIVDEWMLAAADEIELLLREAPSGARWALEALRRWQAFQGADPGAIPCDCDPAELEMFGSEYARKALEMKADGAAVELLWKIWEAKQDHWTAKDVALDLALNWERLREIERARELRQALLDSVEQMGAYALFEALMRIGRPISPDLWDSVTARLADLAFETPTDPHARRQIALAYDAILWRRCPGREREAGLLKRMLAAAEDDELLRAAMAAAGAYHHNGLARVKKHGEPPTPNPHPSAECAREMAWMIEWHFAHQSRCRALASRRTFLSTVELFEESDRPRYLDRSVRKHPLDPAHRKAIVALIGALLQHRETADWALHLIMNVHATSGEFTVPDAQISKLDELLDPKRLGMGVLSAALTYAPGEQSFNLLAALFKEESACRALQEAYAAISVDGVPIAEPRFSITGDPWQMLDRWDAIPDPLPLGAGSAHELSESIAMLIEVGVETEVVERGPAERALGLVSRGHVTPIATWHRGRSAYESDDDINFLVFIVRYFEGLDG